MHIPHPDSSAPPPHEATHTCTHENTHTHTHPPHTRSHSHTSTCRHTHMHTYSHAHIHTHTLNVVPLLNVNSFLCIFSCNFWILRFKNCHSVCYVSIWFSSRFFFFKPLAGRIFKCHLALHLLTTKLVFFCYFHFSCVVLHVSKVAGAWEQPFRVGFCVSLLLPGKLFVGL